MCSIKGKEGGGCVDALASSASFVLLGFFSKGGMQRLFFPLRGKGVKEMGVPFMSLMRGCLRGI